MTTAGRPGRPPRRPATEPPTTGEDRPLGTAPLRVFGIVVTLGLLTINLVAKLLTPVEARSGSAVLHHFDVNLEGNVPTMWNGALLLAVAFACVAVAALHPARLRWSAVAVVAVAMAADETLKVHEHLGVIGTQVSSATGLPLATYAWVVPGVVLAVALLALVVLWVRDLPGDVRTTVLVGAGMYVAGALGAEALSGLVHARSGITTVYDLVTAVEEGLEMLGCLVVVVGVLRMLVVDERDGRRRVAVRVGTVDGPS